MERAEAFKRLPKWTQNEIERLEASCARADAQVAAVTGKTPTAIEIDPSPRTQGGKEMSKTQPELDRALDSILKPRETPSPEAMQARALAVAVKHIPRQGLSDPAWHLATLKLNDAILALLTAAAAEADKQATEHERKLYDNFVMAADVLRDRWLNDGHEMREPSTGYFRKAREDYDKARAAIRSGGQHG